MDDDYAFISAYINGHHKISKWMYQLDPKLVAKHLRYMEKYEIKPIIDSKLTVKLLMKIRDKKRLPIVDEIEDVVIYALLKYNRIADLQKLNIPYVSFDVIDGKIANGTIKRLKSKSARKI